MFSNAAEARAWKERWKRINEFEIDELRRASPELCVRQFFSLLALGKEMNWHTATPVENAVVRERWRKLREAYHG